MTIWNLKSSRKKWWFRWGGNGPTAMASSRIRAKMPHLYLGSQPNFPPQMSLKSVRRFGENLQTDRQMGMNSNHLCRDKKTNTRSRQKVCTTRGFERSNICSSCTRKVVSLASRLAVRSNPSFRRSTSVSWDLLGFWFSRWSRSVWSLWQTRQHISSISRLHPEAFWRLRPKCSAEIWGYEFVLTALFVSNPPRLPTPLTADSLSALLQQINVKRAFQ